MPNFKGKISDIQPRTKDDNSYLVLKIDGKTFYLHDNDMFSKVEEGNEVKVEFNKNESGDKIFRNIQKVETLSGGSTQSSSSAPWQKRARALELGIEYVTKVDGDKKVSEIAKNFIDFMEAKT